MFNGSPSAEAAALDHELHRLGPALDHLAICYHYYVYYHV